MHYPYPKLRAGYQYQWAADGSVLHLYNRRTRQAFCLPQACGELLCCLDGLTAPNVCTDLSPRTVYRYLCAFARAGLLEEDDPPRKGPGRLLWYFPCRGLRQGRRSRALRIYGRLVEWLWLPVLAAAAAAVLLGAGQLPALRFNFVSLLLVFLANETVIGCLHELAHIAAANARGLPVLYVGAGFDAYLPCNFIYIPLLPYAPGPVRRAVARAGVQANLLFGGALLLLCLETPFFRRELVFWSAVSQFISAAFNLLPLEGTDGDCILNSFPALLRARENRPAKKTGWERFLETALGYALRGMSRVGFVAVLLYLGYDLLLLILGVVLEVLA